MSRIGAACPAERPLSSAFQIKVAEIALIQESTSPAILPETALLPVDLILKAASQRSFSFFIFSFVCLVAQRCPVATCKLANRSLQSENEINYLPG